jgi:hypothetical protein
MFSNYFSRPDKIRTQSYALILPGVPAKGLQATSKISPFIHPKSLTMYEMVSANQSSKILTPYIIAVKKLAQNLPVYKTGMIEVRLASQLFNFRVTFR